MASEKVSSVEDSDVNSDSLESVNENGRIRETVRTSGSPTGGEDVQASSRETSDPFAQLREDLISSFNQLQTCFEEKLKYDGGREAMIDRLHGELQEYKADLLLKMIRPLVMDLINLHDDVGKMAASYEGTALDGAAATLLSLYSGMQVDIENILFRNGFEGFTSLPDEFDPKRQRAMQTIATSESSLDRKIAKRLRKGFSYEDRIIRPELVTVYSFKPAPPS